MTPLDTDEQPFKGPSTGDVDLGIMLSRRMKELGITQASLADAIGVSRGTVGKILNGERMPSLPLVQRMCKSLDMPLDELPLVRMRARK